MPSAGRLVRASALAVLALMAGQVVAAAPAAPPAAVTVRLVAVTAQFCAYAQVEPTARVRVRAGEAGSISGLRVLPGAHVMAGQKLFRLTGPKIDALLMRSENAVRSGHAQLAAAMQRLTAERARLAAHLSTHQAVAQAQGAVAAARGTLSSRQTQLRVRRKLSVVRAPVSGTVLRLDAAEGDRVTADQSVLTLQPRGGLWLKAAFYGADADAIHVGMSGRFVPSGASLGGRADVPVRVASVLGVLTPGGAESVGLLATTPAHWRGGEFGTVTLTGRTRSLPAVPTRALILDRGSWWVVVRTPRGDRPRAVVPGAARGTRTLIEQGLEQGQKVVVNNAYLEFHQGISRRYQPPD